MEEEKVWTVKGLLNFKNRMQAQHPQAELLILVTGSFEEPNTTHYLTEAPYVCPVKFGKRQGIRVIMPETFYHEGPLWNRKRVVVPERTVDLVPTFGARFTVQIKPVYREQRPDVEEDWE